MEERLGKDWEVDAERNGRTAAEDGRQWRMQPLSPVLEEEEEEEFCEEEEMMEF